MMPLLHLLLLAAATALPQHHVPAYVGKWQGVLKALPDGKLPHVPLVRAASATPCSCRGTPR